MSRNNHEKGVSFFNKSGVSAVVRNGNIEQALKVLKRKLSQEGILKDMKKHEHFETGTAKRRRAMAEARRIWEKKKKLDPFMN